MTLASHAWATLANYESQDLVRTKYKEVNGGVANAAHSREIRCSVVQARGYFEAAANSDRNVKPLLIYYGVVGLSRALVMFLNQKREASLQASHGLTAKEWNQVFSPDAPDISMASMVINKSGTLAELASATNHSSHLKNNSSAYNLSYPHGPLPVGKEFNLENLLSRLAEVGQPFTRWKASTNVIRCNMQATSNGVEFRVPKSQSFISLSRFEIDSFFNGTTFAFIREDATACVYGGKRAFSQMPSLSDNYTSVFGQIGELVIVKKFADGTELSKPVQMFMISYALGMLVRYFPSRWMSLLGGTAGDACLPTVLQSLDFIERYYPEVILSFFEDKLDTAER